MLSAISGTDGAVCLAIRALFGDGIVVITGLAIVSIDRAVAADMGDASLFCAISGTDGARCLSIIALFGDGVVVITLFLRVDVAVAA